MCFGILNCHEFKILWKRRKELQMEDKKYYVVSSNKAEEGKYYDEKEFNMVFKTTHVLDKIIKDIDDFRNEYSNNNEIPVQLQVDKLAEIIHELVLTLKYNYK
jgi:hypothetical protein